MTEDSEPNARITVETESQDEEENSTEQSSSKRVFDKLTRREALIAGVLGAAAFSHTTNASRNAKIQFSAKDARGTVPDGDVDEIVLGDNTHLTVVWDGLAERERLRVYVDVKPFGGTYERLAQTYYIAKTETGEGKIEATDLFGATGQLDLTKHSQISTDQLTIENPVEQDWKEMSYRIRVGVVTPDKKVNTSSEDSFTISVGVKYGFGERFGVNFGDPIPPIQ